MNGPAALPDPLVIPLPGGVEMAFRLILAGEFRMGARGFDPGEWYGHREEPAHRVVIPRPFYLGVFPVTQAQYAAMAEQCAAELAAIEGNKGPDPSNFKGPERPVEQVGWDDCVAVCGWLTRAGLLPAGWEAGLPSEAQWEYACRAGTETDYWNGDGEEALAEIGWYDGNSGGETHPVGEKPPNPFGLFDLHGNVWEWCADVYDAKAYRKRVDGWEARAWTKEDAGDDARSRVVRGGSWNCTAWLCRTAIRYRRWPGYRDRLQGFRVCLFPGPVVGNSQSEAGRDRQVGGRGTSPETAGTSPAETEEPGDIDLGAATFPPSGGRRIF